MGRLVPFGSRDHFDFTAFCTKVEAAFNGIIRTIAHAPDIPPTSFASLRESGLFLCTTQAPVYLAVLAYVIKLPEEIKKMEKASAVRVL
jgi:hypothetical protein